MDRVPMSDPISNLTKAIADAVGGGYPADVVTILVEQLAKLTEAMAEPTTPTAKTVRRIA